MSDLKSKYLPYLIAFLPAFFPLYLFKATWFAVPVNLLEVMLVFIFVIFFFTESLWKPKWWARYSVEWKLWHVFLFLAAAILSTIFIQKDLTFIDGRPFDASIRALGILKGWILMPMLYFFMARHTFRQRPSMILLSLDALLLGAGILSLLALKQVLYADFITFDSRASGPFESANYLSLYIGPAVLYGFVQSMEDPSLKAISLFRLFLTVISAAALYFTQSYAAYLALLAALIIWLIFSFRSLPKSFKKALTAFSFFILIFLILTQVNSAKFQQFLEFSERSSTSVRLQVYEISLNLITQKPFLGWGLGSFEWAYQNQAAEILGKAPFEWVMLHPHNIFLAMWLNMGILGLAAFIWMLVSALAWLFEPDKKGRRIAALLLVMILIHGIFDTPYFKNDLAFEFWLLMAILL